MRSAGTPQVNVRSVAASDRAEVERLWTLLVDHQQAIEPRLKFAADALDRWRADIGHWVKSDFKRVWVAEDESALVGFLTAERSHSPAMFAPRLEVLISEIFVTVSHRGQGIGTQLLSQARDWAREVGASGVSANVLAANEEGRRFWKNAGGRPFFETTVIEIDSAHKTNGPTPRPIGFENL